MGHVIIDRRKNDKGKSSVNRRKFIDRVKGILKDGVKDIVRDGGMKDLAAGKGKKVKIPNRQLEEPEFHHDGSGINDRVLPGNDRYKKGDKFARPKQGGGGGSGDGEASQDGEGEDSFTFHLTKEEFLDLFFDNCALPDLVKQNLAVMSEEVIQRSGFTTDGAPSQLNIMRSMRGAKGRRAGLRALKNKKLRELEEKRDALIADITNRKANSLDCLIEEVALEKLEHEIEVLKRRMKAIPFLDPIDLRYNNWSKVQIPKVQAAMLCLMDVSGSMDEQLKQLAKTFYLMLYLFLVKNYEKIEVEYITYHTVAKVVDEQEFFYGTDTGGTMTSRGLELTYQTIVEKYNPEQWNIYVAHASDGDNWSADNTICEDILRKKILPIVQYYAYVQVNSESQAERATQKTGSNLWSVFEPLSQTQKNVSAAVITSEENVYPVFMKLFKRKT